LANLAKIPDLSDEKYINFDKAAWYFDLYFLKFMLFFEKSGIKFKKKYDVLKKRGYIKICL
jgi:hypothetical protein